MTTVIGIVGAGALFALFAFVATRPGTRLEGQRGCQGDVISLNSCAREDECEGCGQSDHASGWWPEHGAKDGDRR